MIGIFSKSLDSNLIEATCIAGADFIILDREHGLVSKAMLSNHIRATKSYKTEAIVRVKRIDSNEIGSALDAGADGIQVPNVSTAEDAKKAIDAARFYPDGNRGVCRFVNAASYGMMERNEYFIKENKKKIILQVEGTKGIENLDAIITQGGFDIVFIGPYDLSQSLGLIGQIEHPKVLEQIEHIAKKAKSKGIKLGTFSDSIAMAQKFISLGFDYIAYSVDINIYAESCTKLFNEIKRK